MIGVLLADDDQIVRTGVRLILDAEDDIEVVGEASSGRDAIEATRRLRPAVVLMDIEMPDVDGIEACRQITAASDDTRVVMLTTFQSDDYLFESLQAGASGFLLKRSAPAELLNAVRVVANGEALLASSITLRIIEEFTRRKRTTRVDDQRFEHLTEREIEVLGLVGRGLNNAEIADMVHISESTAKTHLKRILMKLGLRDRVAAVVFAHEVGIVDTAG
jgi:DNA-binding NarL/FixJ family response regulator